MPGRTGAAESYDLTRRPDPYIASRLAHHLGPAGAGRYLDLGCGTGNYTLALTRAGFRFRGVDRSLWMLSAARQKTTSVPWCLGVAEALPFSDGSFSGAVCVLAIHYFPDLRRAFAEVGRVVCGGRFVIFTATPEQMKGYWLNEYFPEAMKKSIDQMPGLPDVADALRHAGFSRVETEPYSVRDDLEDLFFYCGKRRPELYLNPQVRAAISTFSVHATTEETEEGCRRLQADIQSGRILKLIASYDTGTKGDYVFVIGHRS